MSTEIREKVTQICIMRTNFFLTGMTFCGKWEIADGILNAFPNKILPGTWLWIEPADGLPLVFGHGSYRMLANSKPEGLEGYSGTWTGTIHIQQIPPSVVNLAKRMCEWEVQNSPTNIISENVTGFYSKQLARSAVDSGGMPAGVWDVFDTEISRTVPRGFVTGVRY